VSQTKDKRIVMICDDDKDIVTTLTMGLERLGFEVHGFNDPILAVQHIEDVL